MSYGTTPIVGFSINRYRCPFGVLCIDSVTNKTERNSVDVDSQRIRFGLALRAARVAKSLTQNDIAEAISKDQSVVSSYERGDAEPPRPIIAALELLVDLEPGGLSRYLGYIPVDPADAPEPVVVHSRSATAGTRRLALQIEDMNEAVQRAIEPWVERVGAVQSQMVTEMARLEAIIGSLTDQIGAPLKDPTPLGIELPDIEPNADVPQADLLDAVGN
jgi:transcriptional regulator with XRE-family HTH domain